MRIGLATTTRELTARHTYYAAFRGIVTEIIVHDREEFLSPIDRGQLNGDPIPSVLRHREAAAVFSALYPQATN